ncbi:SNT2 [Candida theae]|uniref:SNT2 n=1 Tax=Candida theae TaxID=1198502 RepID=A0AAD5FYU2_9ASCO|nr:SNT2 [Candida theae]KAI5958583.1 SNT2 [Candida theae]
MSQTTSRPKRKAAINKVYNDSLDSQLDYDSSTSSVLSTTSSAISTPRSNSSKKRKKTNPPTKKLSVPETALVKSRSDSPTSSIPYNWQAPPRPEDYFSNKLDLTDSYIDLKTQTLYCPHHNNATSTKRSKNNKPFSLSKGQCIYMISEPPGEPYYIGRIRGFTSSLHQKYNDGNTAPHSESNSVVSSKGYQFLVQWFFRPRDVSKASSDSRLLYATMDSDTCPLVSFRGVVDVELKQDIEDDYYRRTAQVVNGRNRAPSKSQTPTGGISPIEAYVQNPNCFYFDRLYDRYMIRSYDVLSTNNLLQYAQVENSKSKNFLIALNKRFQYIFCETHRTKSLVNSFKANTCNCDICGLWCDGADSISCVECNKYFHMFCLDPPLLKKPSRGFSWSCAVCTKKHEIEYHQKKILMLSHDNKSSNQESLEEELGALGSLEAEVEDLSKTQSVDACTNASAVLPRYELMAKEFLEDDANVTFEERRLKEEWCMRYLGLNAKLEEAVDLDDKSPYPRASTRVGAKHQAVYIPECNGHPIVYYDEEKSPKKKTQNNKSKGKEKQDEIQKLLIPKEYQDVDPREYPSWLQPRPKGYIERGVDDGAGVTCTLLWKSSEKDIANGFQDLDAFVARCAPIAESLGLSPNSPNFCDAVTYQYMIHNGDAEAAFADVSKLDKKKLKEPVFNREEVKRFESGVKEFGNELYFVQKKVKTQPIQEVVRFYYLWKKSKNGREIWGNFEGRTKKSHNTVKQEQQASKKPEHIIIDDLANANDDSSYENDKIQQSHAKFLCKHCNTDYSIQWFRVSGHDAKKLDENGNVVALCFRCARLWRRYAVVWESPEEVLKKVSKSSGWRKGVDSELLSDANAVLHYADSTNSSLSQDDVRTNKPMGAGAIDIKQEPVSEKKADGKKKPVNMSVTAPKSIKVEPSIVKHEAKVPKQEREEDDKPLPRIDELIAKGLGVSTKNLLFSPKYLAPRSIRVPKKITAQDAKATLSPIIDHYREVQLADVYSPLSALQTPHLTSIELPFKPHERKCCVCREHDTEKSALSEMLICANCGVNVHGSCAGYALPEKVKPVKEWLCEPCTNDMRPIHSAIYSCCLCLAHETNFELSILGSPHVRPDFLKPTSDGRWSHLLCAAFNSEYANFKEPKGTDVAHSFLSLDDVSKVYLNNCKIQCGICQAYNGSLVPCDLCETPSFYHPTCAQDTPNYKLGFKLDTEVKPPQTAVKVDGKVGKLRTMLVCPKHDQSKETILNFRTLGRRVASRDSETKPIIQLYLKDLVKSNRAVSSGPHAKALNYIEHRNMYFGKSVPNTSGDSKSRGASHRKRCSNCLTDMSPMWWAADVKGSEGSSSSSSSSISSSSCDSVLCQSCHHNGVSESLTTKSTELADLSKPLNGEFYFIENEKDTVKNVYHSKLIDESSLTAPIEPVRSKISLGDILI